MLMQIFKTILLISAVGSFLAMFLLLLKPVTRKVFSPRWQYYIWLTVLVVMILPAHFKTPKGIANIPVFRAELSEKSEADNFSARENQTDDLENSEKTEKFSTPKIKLPQNIAYYSANIWLWVAIGIILTKIIKYNFFLRAIHKNSEADNLENIPKGLKVRRTDMLDAPLIVGLFKPTLFLPDSEISKNELNYILMHELTHYRRRDILYKWFAMIVSSIHWFNPFAYIVSKEIDSECEISCDYEVTKSLSDSEKNNYMTMILDLLSCSKSSFRPLTTQMASSKKTIKRRFTMIKNKKATNKIISVISAFLAVIMLSATVFASGALADFTLYAYTIEILNNGEKIELSNKPFTENGEVYVPLRETLEKALSKDEGVIDIHWDNGTIDVIVAYYQGESGMYQFKIGKGFMKLKHISYEDYINNSIEKSVVVTSLSLKQAAILKNSLTYVTLKDINYMLYGYTSRRDENNKLSELNYIVYDEKGKILSAVSYPIYSSVEPVEKESQADATFLPYSGNPQNSAGEFLKPYDGTITNPYQTLATPFGSKVHKGIDYKGNVGDPIKASADGTVTFAGWSDDGYGNLVIVNHGNGVETLYAHLASVCVTVGQKISRGEALGMLGNTGNSTGAHLHFELKIGGESVNPEEYYAN